MHAAIAILLIACVITNFKTEHRVPEGEINLVVGTNQYQRTMYNVIPRSEIIDKHIMHQEHDYSCGSAALGTLLNGYLGEQLSEKQIIQGMMKHGDKEQIKVKRAFSLWDMQKFLAVIGYNSAGYTAEKSDLINPEHWPAIVPIEVFNYRHFVVIRGIYKNHVFVSDPWMGNYSYTLNDFLKAWHKNILFKVFPNNGTTNKLSLRHEDLKIIDNEMARQIIFPMEVKPAMPEEHRKWEDAVVKPYDWSSPGTPVYFRPGYTRNGG